MYHCFILDGGKEKKGTNVVPPKDGFMDLDVRRDLTRKSGLSSRLGSFEQERF